MKTAHTPGPMAATQWLLPSGTKHIALVSRTDPDIGAVALFGAVGDELHERSQADAAHFAKCVNGYDEAVWMAKYIVADAGHDVYGDDEDSTLLGFRPPARTSAFRAPFMRAAQWLIEQGLAQWDGRSERYIVLSTEPT